MSGWKTVTTLLMQVRHTNSKWLIPLHCIINLTSIFISINVHISPFLLIFKSNNCSVPSCPRQDRPVFFTNVSKWEYFFFNLYPARGFVFDNWASENEQWQQSNLKDTNPLSTDWFKGKNKCDQIASLAKLLQILQ